jgi:hypothetical protein
MPELNILARANSYEQLQKAMRARKIALNISNETLDNLAGIDGHCGKMLADPPAKKMGLISFGLILQALGLELLVVEDAEQMRKLASRMVERCSSQVRMLAGGKHGPITLVFSRRYMRKLAVKGGHTRKLKLQPWRRRQIARKAARARWG